MSDIASALEQEFTQNAQAERNAHIEEMRKLDAAGRGSMAVHPSAKLFAVLLMLIGVALAWGVLAGRFDGGLFWGCALGALASLAGGIWLLTKHGRQPTFTLTEDGIDVRGVLLPWESIDECEVFSQEYWFFPIRTDITVHHVPGYEAPKLPVPRNVGQSVYRKKEAAWKSYFGFFTGPRDMKVNALAAHIDRLRAGALARAELQRLGA